MYPTDCTLQLQQQQAPVRLPSNSKSAQNKNISQLKLTYFIFVYRIWEAGHLNQDRELREKYVTGPKQNETYLAKKNV